MLPLRNVGYACGDSNKQTECSLFISYAHACGSEQRVKPIAQKNNLKAVVD
eukprot:m.11140 g.11140  ORF g.11140 m.11140 type:complete len:51 (+) comp5671_c0_seq1:236-388(+)